MTIDELSLSVACLLDEPSEVTREDLEYLQNLITIIEREVKRNECR